MCKAFGHKKHIDITRTVTDFYLKYDIMLLRHRCALFRNERSLSLAAACTAVCMLFAGCGDGDSSTAESKAAETSAQTDAASEAESAAPESEAEESPAADSPESEAEESTADDGETQRICSRG